MLDREVRVSQKSLFSFCQTPPTHPFLEAWGQRRLQASKKGWVGGEKHLFFEKS